MNLTEQDMSATALRVGSLYVIGGLEGQGIQSIVTQLETTRSVLQSLSADSRKFIKNMIDDGLISPTEKKQLQKELLLIETEYSILIEKALQAKLDESGMAISGYRAVYTSLLNYLYTDLLLFDDISSFTPVDKSIFLKAFTDYYSARDELVRATTDGLILEVKEYAESLDDSTNQRIDNVRLGDIIDGALNRSKLESGLLDEISKTGSTLFPNGFDRESKIDLIEPRTILSSEMIEHLFDLVSESEAQLLFSGREISLVSSKVETDRTRIASLEMNLDSITQTVAELIPLGNGQIANLSQIQQTAEAISLLVTTGQYNAENGLIDSYSLAQAKLAKDRFELFVQGQGSDWDNAEWIVKHDEIVSAVQGVIETDQGVSATITQMIQNSEGISMSIRDLRAETIERLDSALAESQAGLILTSSKIEAGVQDLERKTQSLLTLQAEQISAIVQDIEKNTAAALSLKTDQIAALVKSGESEAYLSLSVTLPAVVNDTTRGKMIKAVSKDAFDAVYTLTSTGFWYIRNDAPTADVKALKTALRTAGLLGSQIALDADEILMGGKVKAKHLDIESINATKEITVATQQISGLGLLATKDSVTIGEVVNLSTTLAGKETSGAAATAEASAKNTLAQRLGYASFDEMDYLATHGQTLITGGKIRTSLIETDVILGKDAIFSGSLNAAQGTFTGSVKIDSDPNSTSDFEVYLDKVNGFLIKNNSSSLVHFKPDGSSILNSVTIEGNSYLSGLISPSKGVLNTWYLKTWTTKTQDEWFLLFKDKIPVGKRMNVFGGGYIKLPEAPSNPLAPDNFFPCIISYIERIHVNTIQVSGLPLFNTGYVMLSHNATSGNTSVFSRGTCIGW